MKKYLIFLGILIFILPTVSLALDAGLSPATKGIVPCNGTDCNFCHVVELGQNILTWLIGIIAAVIALVFVIGGLKMVMAGGNENQVTGAKQMMTNAIVGFIILLASWLIVDTILKVLVMEDPTAEGPANIKGYGPWNQIECGPAQVPGTTPPPSEEGAPENLVTYAGYQFDSTVVGNVQTLVNNFNLQVTSGYRDPEHNASVGGVPNSYHLTGRAADFTGSSADMLAAEQWARANGAVEVLRHDVGSGYHLHVAW